MSIHSSKKKYYYKLHIFRLRSIPKPSLPLIHTQNPHHDKTVLFNTFFSQRQRDGVPFSTRWSVRPLAEVFVYISQSPRKPANRYRTRALMWSTVTPFFRPLGQGVAAEGGSWVNRQKPCFILRNRLRIVQGSFADFVQI